MLPIDAAVKFEYRYPRWLPLTIAGTGAAVALGGLGLWLSGRSQMDHFVTDFQRACPTGCDQSFTGQPGVANGASELFGAAFGDAGTHARSAVGVPVLPLDSPVEVELIVEVG